MDTRAEIEALLTRVEDMRSTLLSILERNQVDLLYHLYTYFYIFAYL